MLRLRSKNLILTFAMLVFATALLQPVFGADLNSDAPTPAEVQAALDRLTENGQAKTISIYPNADRADEARIESHPIEIQTTVIQARNEQELTEVTAVIQNLYEVETKANPYGFSNFRIFDSGLAEKSLDRLAVIAESIRSRVPDSVNKMALQTEKITDIAYKSIKSKITNTDGETWFFSIARLTINGGLVATGLVLSHKGSLDFMQTVNYIAAGGMVGALSFVNGLYNQEILNWLMKPAKMVSHSATFNVAKDKLKLMIKNSRISIKTKPVEDKVVTRLFGRNVSRSEVNNFGAMLSRWYLMENIFINAGLVLQSSIGTIRLNMASYTNNFLISTLETATFSLGAQGMCDFAIGVIRDKSLRTGVERKNAVFYSDMASTVISGFSVGLAFADTLKLPFAKPGMVIMGAVGLVTLSLAQMKKVTPVCRRVFD